MRGTRLSRAFYDRPALEVTTDLIGKILVHRTPDGETGGIIVEVEAYIGESDPACHAAPGPTPRNRPLYGEPGHAYVYLNYGIHALVNVVAEPAGSPAAILIRALEPTIGVPLMRQRRMKPGKGVAAMPPGALDADVCRGPGNLTRAMGITLADNLRDLTGNQLFVLETGIARAVAWSGRIGIRVGTESRWRCYDPESRAVSGPRRR